MHQTSKNATESSSAETPQPAPPLLNVRTGQARILMPYPSRFDLLPKLESVENGLRRQFLVPDKFKAHIYIQDATGQFHYIPNEEKWQKILQAELLLSRSEVINLLVSPKHRFRPENHTDLNFDSFDFLQCDILRLPIPTDSAATEMQPITSADDTLRVTHVTSSYPPEQVHSSGGGVMDPQTTLSYNADLPVVVSAQSFSAVDETQCIQATVVDFSATGNQVWTTNTQGTPQDLTVKDSSVNCNVEQMPEFPQHFASNDSTYHGSGKNLAEMSHVNACPEISRELGCGYTNGDSSMYFAASKVLDADIQEIATEKQPVEGFPANGHSDNVVGLCVQSDDIFALTANQVNGANSQCDAPTPMIHTSCEEVPNNHDTPEVTPELPVLTGAEILASLGEQRMGDKEENRSEFQVLEVAPRQQDDVVSTVANKWDSSMEKWQSSFDEKLDESLQSLRVDIEQKLTSLIHETVHVKMECCLSELKEFITKTVATEKSATEERVAKTVAEAMRDEMRFEMRTELSALMNSLKEQLANKLALQFEEARANQREIIDSRFEFIVLSLKSGIAALNSAQISMHSLASELKQDAVAKKHAQSKNPPVASRVNNDCETPTEQFLTNEDSFQIEIQCPPVSLVENVFLGLYSNKKTTQDACLRSEVFSFLPNVAM